jgi:DNA invertase Pin-like site-specific DNA recombinase
MAGTVLAGLAVVRAGDTVVVPKLDRLARSVPDARDIGDALVARGVRLSLGGSGYNPADPMSKLFFNMLAVFAEFKADLLKMRTREGMAIARSRGRLKGRQPKLTVRQQAELVRMHATGDYTIAELMEVFSVGRATVCRTLARSQPASAMS